MVSSKYTGANPNGPACPRVFTTAASGYNIDIAPQAPINNLLLPRVDGCPSTISGGAIAGIVIGTIFVSPEPGVVVSPTLVTDHGALALTEDGGRMWGMSKSQGLSQGEAQLLGIERMCGDPQGYIGLEMCDEMDKVRIEL
ncbi:hypothetical protein N7495_009745 [Penicillium taxi]|uniref:uncharacterized protein n=1 Tax=Penicillium taxi TaxID=168475 RepID=UPI0025454E14|nr:uncharacterized protein N7495_009745 [Penicillium taxi]KAJ5885235.1 hypothetical protein N7495_009745 [Penicillium taxi]